MRCAALRRLAGSRLDVAPLLPVADAGWRLAAFQKHATEFSVIAGHHGLTVSDYMRQAAGWLAQNASRSEVRIRMRPSNFEQFLLQEQYLTQFELPTASGGAKHRALRLMLEHTVSGVPTSAAPRHRPIYGYLSGTHEAGQIQQYGEVVLRLRPAVRRRATFMLGDSLDHALPALIGRGLGT
ncbi:MAG: hypothetical protein QOC68_2620 [Solirubrobacteraceae bacterium]|nr:hypothetical protein [Solirubrobacteraceae bacterium]